MDINKIDWKLNRGSLNCKLNEFDLLKNDLIQNRSSVLVILLRDADVNTIKKIKAAGFGQSYAIASQGVVSMSNDIQVMFNDSDVLKTMIKKFKYNQLHSRTAGRRNTRGEALTRNKKKTYDDDGITRNKKETYDDNEEPKPPILGVPERAKQNALCTDNVSIDVYFTDNHTTVRKGYDGCIDMFEYKATVGSHPLPKVTAEDRRIAAEKLMDRPLILMKGLTKHVFADTFIAKGLPLSKNRNTYYVLIIGPLYLSDIFVTYFQYYEEILFKNPFKQNNSTLQHLFDSTLLTKDKMRWIWLYIVAFVLKECNLLPAIITQLLQCFRKATEEKIEEVRRYILALDKSDTLQLYLSLDISSAKPTPPRIPNEKQLLNEKRAHVKTNSNIMNNYAVLIAGEQQLFSAMKMLDLTA